MPHDWVIDINVIKCIAFLFILVGNLTNIDTRYLVYKNCNLHAT